MRRLSYHVASTVDGFIADVDHGVGALAHEGDHVADYMAALRGYQTIVMGRRTYEFGVRLGVTDPYPWAETIVFSRTMTASPELRVRITAEDPVVAVHGLKAQEGSTIYLCGGGELARTLLDAGLVDEVIVKVSPTLLGGGIGLAPRLAGPRPLRLRSTKVHASGVVVLGYDVVHAA